MLRSHKVQHVGKYSSTPALRVWRSTSSLERSAGFQACLGRPERPRCIKVAHVRIRPSAIPPWRGGPRAPAPQVPSLLCAFLARTHRLALVRSVRYPGSRRAFGGFAMGSRWAWGHRWPAGGGPTAGLWRGHGGAMARPRRHGARRAHGGTQLGHMAGPVQAHGGLTAGPLRPHSRPMAGPWRVRSGPTADGGHRYLRTWDVNTRWEMPDGGSPVLELVCSMQCAKRYVELAGGGAKLRSVSMPFSAEE